MTKLYGSRTRMLHARLPNADVVAVNANHVDKYFGDLTRGQRTSCGLSQERLARKLRIDPEDIDAYETGMKHMSTDLVPQIARACSGRCSPKLPRPCATEHNQGNSKARRRMTQYLMKRCNFDELSSVSRVRPFVSQSSTSSLN